MEMTSLAFLMCLTLHKTFLVYIQNYIFIDYEDASKRTTCILAIPMEMPTSFLCLLFY